MTTYNVNELEGDLLDAAVAKAEGRLVVEDEPGWNKGEYKNLRQEYRGRHVVRWYADSGELGGWEPLDNQGSPSTDWSYGGPIIDRESISVMRDDGEGDWVATTKFFFQGGIDGPSGNGPTPLIAAMRAYVASKFGESIDLDA